MGGAGGEDFCFLFNVQGTLSSGFLFFARSAWACSSLKLCGAELVDIVPESCALGSGSLEGPMSVGGGLRGGFPSAVTTAPELGDGPNLNTILGCSNCWAEEVASLADAALTSACGVVSVVCCKKDGVTFVSAIG
jgi:hypothetical protein